MADRLRALFEAQAELAQARRADVERAYMDVVRLLEQLNGADAELLREQQAGKDGGHG